MPEGAPSDRQFDVECPHCHRSFRAQLLAPRSAQAGFKCPHCRLFVSFDRVAGSTDEA
jgi:transposase-like protein